MKKKTNSKFWLTYLQKTGLQLHQMRKKKLFSHKLISDQLSKNIEKKKRPKKFKLSVQARKTWINQKILRPDLQGHLLSQAESRILSTISNHH